MRQFVILFALLILTPLTGHSGEPLSAEEFDRYTRGKTLFYGFAGQAYGVERYLPGQRVIWSFLDGRCQEGHWYQEADQICFVYEDRLDPQCWSFELSSKGLFARFENDPQATELYEAEDFGAEMYCMGPDTGV
ncbi:hypothetical protein RSK20926_15076 [Roseobacter sp. SK209-2-6]|uniref:hypothetical protein n=1 Tax=Roseobacter sp. SK209-2-6 TaxID=388739 RepID=UPI0000F3EF35|nr:hypothetical protein [Roseobacter sp. SK209-2-6]EBA15551.1 hypothetical protein RSK20926_15076 [Roseobacter sp. SK209-2-6]